MPLSQFWLSSSERRFFKSEGYLLVENALSGDEIERLIQATKRHTSVNTFYNRVDILGLDPSFTTLAVNHPVLGKICGLLGWNIYVNHTHFNVRPPNEGPENYPYGWHSDGGTLRADVTSSMPLTAIKVGFYLTDLDDPERGQTYIIPKRITDANPVIGHLGEYDTPPPEARPVTLKRGSALLFQQGAVHSQGSPNLSGDTRRTVFVQWAYRWMRPVDTMSVTHLDEQTDHPILRQMLGFSQPRQAPKLSSFYYPLENDLPLRREILTSVATGKVAEIGPGYARQVANLLPFNT